MQEQIQNNDNESLQSIKDAIRGNINASARSFVEIGYYLKLVRDGMLFQSDGYQSIWEFAQKEFGISKSSASRFMAINDKFSINGNSLDLLDTYKDFSSSKLQEMLTLSDEQLEQVTLATTVAEIREIKNPDKSDAGIPVSVKTVATSQQNSEQSDEDKRCIRISVLKKMCDSICKMSSYILEKNRYDMNTIRGLSSRDYSFGFGSDGHHHSKYDAICKNGQYLVEEFDGDGKWVFESGEIEQQIWNNNGRQWHFDNPLQSIDDLDFSVRTYNCLRRAGIPTVEKLCSMTEDEVRQIHNFSDKCLSEVKEKLAKIDKVLKVGVVEVHEVKEDILEVIEADVIRTHQDKAEVDINEGNLEENPEEYRLWEVEEELNKLTEYLDVFREDDSRPPARRKMKMQLDAITLLANDMKKETNEDEPMVRKMARFAMDFFESGDYGSADFYLFHARNDLAKGYEYERDFYPDYFNDNRKPQPQLPKLKNNEQRKEWIDSYSSWPVWINLPHTGEKLYRYDLPDNVAIVVKVSKKHRWENYKESKDYEYGAEQYYLLGVNTTWSASQKDPFTLDDARTFYECNTNKSTLVEYLKELQKKG